MGIRSDQCRLGARQRSGDGANACGGICRHHDVISSAVWEKDTEPYAHNTCLSK
jgi:hypothetical protein